MNLKNTLLAATAAASLMAGPAQAAGKAKNVIFFLGDGMGPTTVTATRIYLYGEAGKLQMEKLDYAALVRTYSLDAQTTDSAPSMGAYMTGVKARNEVLSMNGDTVADFNNCVPGNGASVPTFLEQAKARGKAVGAITTTELTHATPAATYAHICHRDRGYDIAAQAVPGGAGFNAALGSGVDVLLGGGANHWLPTGGTLTAGRPDGRDLLAELGAQGYSVVRSAAALRSLPATATKLVGLFTDRSHLAYELDRDPAKEPSLAEMTVKAIEVLQRASAADGDDQGFFLMVEGGRIDHALHGTQAQKALADAAAFDTAIAAAMARVDLSNTLIVVTADHDHSVTMNGYGQRGQGTHVVDLVREPGTGIPLLDADGYTYPTLVFGNGPTRPSYRSGLDTVYVLDKSFLGLTAVRTGSETHAGGDVMLMAGGADAQLFRGSLDNVEVYGLLLQASGLDQPVP